SGRARIFITAAKPQLYEGPRLVSKVRSRSLPLRDLFGWGWPLLTSSSDEPSSTVVNCVEDRGCMGVYLPSLFGKPLNRLRLRIPIQPGPDYRIWAWPEIDGSPKQVAGDSITSDLDGFVWNLPDLGR